MIFRSLVFCIALLVLGTQQANAVFTVGPDGNYPTIQSAVNAAVSSGMDSEVRVEVKYCYDIHGFSYVCPFKENVSIYNPSHSINLIGGWNANFQTLSATRTWIQGTRANAPTLDILISTTSATVSVSGFDINNSGITAQYSTHGMFIRTAGAGVQVIVHDNTIRNNSSNDSGGAGIYASATSGSITINNNLFESNTELGTTNSYIFGGAVDLEGGTAYESAKLAFENNVLNNNTASNPNGGPCHGGAVYAYITHSGSTLTQSGNVWSGNQQFACSNGATGDAEEIYVGDSAVAHITSESWTSNNTANDPGVYEVFMQATNYGTIYAGNGLITHGTWGGLYAKTDSTSTIEIVNYTIADNPVLGANIVGPGSTLWNTILWNDGTPYATSGGAYPAYILTADPRFVDSANGNYRLTLDSPAINTGYNNIPNGPYYYDLDGSPRPYTGDGVYIADIGAYEYHANDRIFRDGFDTP